MGNKYGTPSPVPFRVVDQRAGIDIDVGIRCFGEYSYHIANPVLFYTNVCGNVSEAYTPAGQPAEDGTADRPTARFCQDRGERHPLLSAARSYHGAGRRPERGTQQEVA